MMLDCSVKVKLMSTILFNKQMIPAEQACISHQDRGFTLGHGLFETLLISNNVCPALDYHWKRLVASAPLLGINPPFSRTELTAMLSELVIANQLQHKLAGARVTLTHGEAARGILPDQSPKTTVLISVFECPTPNNKPCSTMIARTTKNEGSAASRVKCISYIDNILARQEAREQACDEAILCNSKGHIADASTANVFMVKDGLIVTPLVADGALPGVVRAMLLDSASIIERSISPAELMAADELFLTNALMGVKSVKTLNGQHFSSVRVARQMAALLREKHHYPV